MVAVGREFIVKNVSTLGTELLGHPTQKEVVPTVLVSGIIPAVTGSK